MVLCEFKIVKIGWLVEIRGRSVNRTPIQVAGMPQFVATFIEIARDDLSASRLEMVAEEGGIRNPGDECPVVDVRIFFVRGGEHRDFPDH